MEKLIRVILIGVMSVFSCASILSAADIIYTYDSLGRLIGADYGPGGQLSYSYDAAGNRITATSVAADNEAPVAVDDVLSVGQDEAGSLNPLTNDTDADGDVLSILSATDGSSGTVTVVNGLTLTYTPAAGFSGADSFSYTIVDAYNNSATANVAVTVVENIAPVAVDDILTADQDDTTSLDPMANDTDAEGDTLSIVSATNGSNGTVEVVDGLTLSYTPASGFNGSDSFSYTISDGHSNTATANITVTVTENLAPVAVDDVLSVGQDEVGLLDPLINDTDIEGDTLSITSTVDGSNGTVTLVDSSTLSYTPAAGFNGSDSFTYTISDGHSNNATGTVTVTVVENVAPVAADDVLSVGQDEAGLLDPLTNDTDAEGDTLSVTSATDGSNGTVIVVDGLTLNYTPAAGFNGSDSFTYTISDGHSNTTTATVAVTVVENVAPVAVNDVLAVDHNTPASLAPLTNDSDAENDILSITSVTNGSNGTVAIDGLMLTYTPASGFSGVDNFSYTVSDGHSNSATANVAVTVSANATPVAVDDILLVDHDTIGSLDPLANDTDLENDTLTITSATDGNNGVVAIVGGLTLTYTPSSGFSGADSFSYTISDGQGNNATASVSVTVSANVAPIAVDDYSVTDPSENNLLIYPMLNDTDADGDPLTILSFTAPQYGSVSKLGKSLRYNADGAYVGADNFTYTVSDGNNHTATATIHLDVTLAGNQAPIAVDDTMTALQGVGYTSFDPRTNDTDPDGEAIVVKGATNSVNGGRVNNSSTFVQFKPEYNFVGTDSFIYTIQDGAGNSSTATVFVTVPQNPNAAPIAIDDTVSVDHDSSVTIYPLINDTDPEGDALSLISGSLTFGMTEPGHGGLTVYLSSGEIVYTPEAGFSGSDSFTYWITDGHRNAASATISITVNSNATPVATDDVLSVGQGDTATIDPLINDTDSDNDTLTIASATDGANGAVIVNNGLALTYTPTLGFSGADSFTYTVSDGNGNSATASVTVTVTENAAPVAMDDALTVAQDGNGSLDPLVNDSDAEGDVLTIMSAADGSNGVVTVVDGLVLSYVPAGGFSGSDSFTYTISDGRGNDATATVVVTVTANAAPVPVDDTLTVTQGESETFDPLANDTDAEGDALTITSATDGVSGVVSVTGGLSLTYTPTVGFVGSDSFTYTISDGHGNSATATVAVTVIPNAAPVALDDTLTVNHDASGTLNPLNNDSDAEGDTLTITSAINGSNGTVVIDGQTLIYTPATGFSGSDSFTYTISDGHGNNASANVVVTINAIINEAPIAANDLLTVDRESTGSIDPLVNDTDPEGDTLTIISAADGTNGTVSVVGGLTLTYTPAAGFSGTDSLIYTVSDGNGNTATAYVLITVNGNLPPVLADDYVVVDPTLTSIAVYVLENDVDPDGDILKLINSFSQPSHGSVSKNNAGGYFVYKPQNAPEGDYSFTYTARDGNGHDVVATVHISVTAAGNLAPIAVNDTLTVLKNSVTIFDPRINDSDPEGQVFFVRNTTQATNGEAARRTNTSIRYTPAADYLGTDTFTYRLTDGAYNISNYATVTVTVVDTITNVAPVAGDDAVSVLEIERQDPIYFDPLINDVDDDGDPLTILSVSDTPYGSVTIRDNGTTLSYKTAVGFPGMDSFTYTIVDGYNIPVTATVNVTWANDLAPVAVDDYMTVKPGETDWLGAGVDFDPRENDYDPEGGSFVIDSLTQPTHGSVTLNNQGTEFSYLSDDVYIGLDTFTYTILDGLGNAATATVHVNVTAAGNQAPVAVDDMVTAKHGLTTRIEPLLNDSDPEGDLIELRYNPSASHGTVSKAGNTAYNYTPDPGFIGVDTFIYRARDPFGESSAYATVTVNVIP